MDYGKRVRNLPRCLECGDKILYGRTDKKFCCEECRMKHFYASSKATRMFKRKILTRTGKHDVYNCFDIKYIMTRARIFSMVKIRNLSVPLQIHTETD